MKLTDLQPVEAWEALENEIQLKTGMRARVYDVNGIGITGRPSQANDLCAAIRATPKGQTYICAVAHQNMAAMAQQANAPVIEECDAGLVKIVVPIFADGAFIGAAGGCGKLLEDGEVDTFMISKTTDLDEGRIEVLSGTVATMTMAEAESLAAFIQERIRALVPGDGKRA